MPVGKQRLYSTTPSASLFTYRLAASAVGKQTPPRPPKINRDFWNYASTGSSAVPYLKSTKPDSGEDAFFATSIGGSPHAVALVSLMALVVGKIKVSIRASTAMAFAADLLQAAYEAVSKDPRIPAGGCTASLGVADGKGQLEAANLGDSGFLILGPGRVSARSEPQTHEFNTPYQLAKVPERMQAQYAIFGGMQHHSETPVNSDVSTHKLKHGDIVLFGTDGVWDNLSAQDTLAIVTKVMEEQGLWFKSHNFAGAETMLNADGIRSISQDPTENDAEKYVPGLIVRAVMREAKLAGLDRKRNGPFAKEVKKHYPHEMWQGGKPDDIAVVVAVAVSGADDTLKAKL
ncbi:hypothetical protein AMS68_002605 [Peltaster fructicola]|uniref:Protein phosphatase n=1 Tax=Peltaster fructicola TaxID=286661 RepID=A0A6H0XR23_9PEZI|nr:hypothetical protein AMS68_002605 [Peltaster fructicola]